MRPQADDLVIVIKRGHIIVLALVAVLFVEHAQFEVRQGGARIDLEGLFKGGDGALVITRANPFFTFDEIGVALLIHFGFAHRRTARKKRENKGNDNEPKQHGRELSGRMSRVQSRSRVPNGSRPQVTSPENCSLSFGD